jgi:hypothetical protein
MSHLEACPLAGGVSSRLGRVAGIWNPGMWRFHLQERAGSAPRAWDCVRGTQSSGEILCMGCFSDGPHVYKGATTYLPPCPSGADAVLRLKNGQTKGKKSDPPGLFPATLPLSPSTLIPPVAGVQKTAPPSVGPLPGFGKLQLSTDLRVGCAEPHWTPPKSAPSSKCGSPLLHAQVRRSLPYI